ncbi:hypothetical protein X766_04025 [Mesorhizobium sp. LSJC255A00]|uniref:hypothetical protein n=1 Tax=Mesorhizobium sp. LSJC255A00 TaxID=1287313 RepID=UPI0003CF44A1|nr:hypothetical protein [Mesorhizobium sp. LSJC255A00]ESX22250.1 hypothetical protein X766_04025 [Mesorhizobium sp. LSJC255A00]
MQKYTKYDDLKLRQQILAEKLQHYADILGKAAIARAAGVSTETDRDQEQFVRAYDETLARIEELTAEEEKLLIEEGILPRKESKKAS